MSDVRPREEIDPKELYSIARACAFLPSSHGGRVTPGTLHRWRKEGIVPATRIGSLFFIQGVDLLKLLPPASPPPKIESSRDFNRRQKAARETLASMGL